MRCHDPSWSNCAKKDCGGDASIKVESQKSVRLSAEAAEWAVTVPANGKASLSASFETRY